MEPSGPDALSSDVHYNSPVTVHFARTAPDIPRHGSARTHIHKPVQHTMLPEQEDWLKANVLANGKRLYGARDKWAYQAMRAAFHDQIRTDTMMPLWLEQKHIATWLAKCVKSEKQKRMAARRADDTGATGTKRRRKQTGHGKEQEGNADSDSEESEVDVEEMEAREDAEEGL